MAADEISKTVGWLGETWGFWIQTGAFLLSAVAASIALFYNARQVHLLRTQTETSERQAKSRATVDVVLHEKSDNEFTAARKKFAELRESGKSLTQYACAKAPEFQEENSSIMKILNQYEFMAAGIRTGAFDEEIYKRMKRGLLIRDWKSLKAYVEELKNQYGRSELYVEFQWLAERWDSEKK
jgi:hypothetical protein